MFSLYVIQTNWLVNAARIVSPNVQLSAEWILNISEDDAQALHSSDDTLDQK